MVKPDAQCVYCRQRSAVPGGVSPSPITSPKPATLNWRGSSMADRTKFKKVTQPPLKDMDREITALFQQWLVAFEKTLSATGDDEAVAAIALSTIESRIAAT